MDLIRQKWYIGYCTQGKTCWCRTISIKPNDDPESNELEYAIACSGELSKIVAEHIVDIHNKWLENDKL